MKAFDDLAHLSDEEMQNWLCKVDTKDLAIALKQASDDVKRKIFENVSERVRGFIEQGMEDSGNVPENEIEEVQNRILQL